MKKLITFILIMLFAVAAQAAGSKSVAPSASKDTSAYNKGVALMLEKKFSDAEKQFRRALKQNDDFAEAHNNLAYTLRKQGPDHFDEAMLHYNRAIELNPEMAEPYMYRGVLFVQLGDKKSALADHDKLLGMNPTLASELEYVVVNGREKEPEQFFGVSQSVK